MPSRHQSYNWPALVEKASAMIRAGKCQPTYVDIADKLKIPRPTVDDRFRSLGISLDLLPHPAKWPKVAPAKVSKRENVDGGQPDSFNGISAAEVVKLLRRSPLTLPDLADRLDRGRVTVSEALAQMIVAGYGIVREGQTVKVPPYRLPDRIPVLSDAKSRTFRFAVASDWHIGSKAAQVSALRAFLDVAVKRYGCQHVLVPGDICAGYGVYRGQANEVYAYAASEQLDALVNTIPKFEGVSYYVMGGNHDYSFMKSSGFNIVEAACRLREDWVYCGFDEATVPLTPDLDIVMWHPSGGVPYALTYRGQKFAAELAQRELVEIITGKKERPRTRFIFWGHLHVAASFPHGPIQVIGPGCFEGRNSYLKQKGLTPMIQGVVVEAKITDEGLIQEFTAHELRYVEQEDDWHNAWIPSQARQAHERIVPMFRLSKAKAAGG